MAYSFLVLAEGSMNNAHVEEDLARVGNLVELGNSIVELIVIVARERGNPRLDFLCGGESLVLSVCSVLLLTNLLQRHGCCRCAVLV